MVKKEAQQMRDSKWSRKAATVPGREQKEVRWRGEGPAGTHSCQVQTLFLWETLSRGSRREQRRKPFRDLREHLRTHRALPAL